MKIDKTFFESITQCGGLTDHPYDSMIHPDMISATTMTAFLIWQHEDDSPKNFDELFLQRDPEYLRISHTIKNSEVKNLNVQKRLMDSYELKCRSQIAVRIIYADTGDDHGNVFLDRQVKAFQVMAFLPREPMPETTAIIQNDNDQFLNFLLRFIGANDQGRCFTQHEILDFNGAVRHKLLPEKSLRDKILEVA